MEAALARVGVADLVEDLDEAAARYNAAWPETERSCSSILETRKVLWRLILDREDDALCERLAIAYDEVRRESGVRLYPGVVDLLGSLGSRYRLGLLTNGSTEMQWPKVRKLDLESFFHAIVVAGDHGVYKPDVEVFQLLAERLEARPERTLFVGDNYETDVRGAHEAGMRTAWLRHPGAEASEPVCHDIEIEAIGDLGSRCP